MSICSKSLNVLEFFVEFEALENCDKNQYFFDFKLWIVMKLLFFEKLNRSKGVLFRRGILIQAWLYWFELLLEKSLSKWQWRAKVRLDKDEFLHEIGIFEFLVQYA